MDRILIIIGLLICLVKTAYGQQRLHLLSKTDEITLYLTAAEVKSVAPISLKEGTTTVVFAGLPISTVENSVQVSLPKGIELLSVATNEVAVDPTKADQNLRMLRDSLESLQQRLEVIQNQVDAFHAEKEMLKQNQHLGGSQTTVSLLELNKAADFFRERNLKINNALSLLNRKLKKLQSESDTLRLQYDTRLGQIKPLRKEVEVVLSSPIAQKIELTYRYLITEAGWSAAYDLVATEVNRPVTLKYKARLYNASGIDWKDVKISLSTGDPSLNASRPYLTAWTLNYNSAANEGQLQYNNNMNAMAVQNAESSDEEIAVAEMSTTFPIEKKHSVPSRIQPYWIDLSTASLDATFEYLTIPKIDLSAFLIAKVAGWEKLNLIDGDANVYFGNAYIGQSRINTRSMSDTLELSLGRDNQIIVSRAKLEDKGETKLIGTKRSEAFKYEILIKNNRNVPITIKIQDQIPVSQESDITVERDDVSNASMDALSGRLQWLKTIPAGQNVELTNAFTVRYPKGKHVNIRKQRLVKTPRYRH
ncbi:DUF4139 domain-containing protein [Pseudochryseolinea flava]|uniref:Mucoidy inhibitor MuiA family protein n=1 Tax=Pseudochryseolinea flava TaxID=2059302 RepID=A0A364Y108_9BACT|nr:DUF4139 domain-containing protein [Pseudochryseolinea flava]RAV99438.1 hypothetical protein DQQ10_19660 [Pseudochryseolinea flava]